MLCPECGHLSRSGEERAEEFLEHVTNMKDWSLSVVLPSKEEVTPSFVRDMAEEITLALFKAGVEPERFWSGQWQSDDVIIVAGYHPIRRHLGINIVPEEYIDAVAVGILEACYLRDRVGRERWMMHEEKVP
mgnify:CR=1 FL=1